MGLIGLHIVGERNRNLENTAIEKTKYKTQSEREFLKYKLVSSITISSRPIYM